MTEESVLAVLARMEAGQARIATSVESLETRLTHVEDNLTKMGDNVTTLADIVTKMGDHVTKLGDDVTKLGDDVTKLGDDVTKLGDDVTKLGDNLIRLRVDCMERMDRFENRMTGVQDDIDVAMGASESARRANINTRESLKDLHDTVFVLVRKVNRLETELRDIKG